MSSTFQDLQFLKLCRATGSNWSTITELVENETGKQKMMLLN